MRSSGSDIERRRLEQAEEKKAALEKERIERENAEIDALVNAVIRQVAAHGALTDDALYAIQKTATDSQSDSKSHIKLTLAPDILAAPNVAAIKASLQSTSKSVTRGNRSGSLPTPPHASAVQTRQTRTSSDKTGKNDQPKRGSLKRTPAPLPAATGVTQPPASSDHPSALSLATSMSMGSPQPVAAQQKVETSAHLSPILLPAQAHVESPPATIEEAAIAGSAGINTVDASRSLLAAGKSISAAIAESDSNGSRDTSRTILTACAAIPALPSVSGTVAASGSVKSDDRTQLAYGSVVDAKSLVGVVPTAGSLKSKPVTLIRQAAEPTPTLWGSIGKMFLGVLFVVGGIVAVPFTGGLSLIASAAGVGLFVDGVNSAPSSTTAPTSQSSTTGSANVVTRGLSSSAVINVGTGHNAVSVPPVASTSTDRGLGKAGAGDLVSAPKFTYMSHTAVVSTGPGQSAPAGP